MSALKSSRQPAAHEQGVFLMNGISAERVPDTLEIELRLDEVVNATYAAELHVVEMVDRQLAIQLDGNDDELDCECHRRDADLIKYLVQEAARKARRLKERWKVRSDAHMAEYKARFAIAPAA
jgi:hypothetical protein